MQTVYWASQTLAARAGPDVQIVYAGVAWVLSVTAVVAGATRRRKRFGQLCLATCALHLCVTGWFNLKILASMGVGPLASVLSGGQLADVAARYYVWNWIGIVTNAAVCYYQLRYEARFWRRRERGEQRGFAVGEEAC